jgi:GrpB-like predicted nucleotidyltransferase (UPF0157 family)
MFDDEAARLTGALGDVVAALHHIGSTAIPGIHAKPVIDMLLEVPTLASLDARSPVMESLGYEAMGEFGIPGRRYFRRNDASGTRTHQVHSFVAGSAEATRHLAFRDYMRAHPDVAREYGALKARLAEEYPDSMDAYMDGKDAFVKLHESLALSWRRRDVGT